MLEVKHLDDGCPLQMEIPYRTFHFLVKMLLIRLLLLELGWVKEVSEGLVYVRDDGALKDLTTAGWMIRPKMQEAAFAVVS